MKGLISPTLTLVCVALGAGLACANGPITYDPCWIYRYSYMADVEVHQAMDPQVANGHCLDQTIWNWQFEPGTDRLTPAGLEHLAYMARRRPEPSCKVFVQTAQDIDYNAGGPDQFVEARMRLDRQRVRAVEKFLAAQTAARPTPFEVTVHDPGDPSVAAIPANIALQQMYIGFRGNLPATAGAGASGVTGGAGAR